MKVSNKNRKKDQEIVSTQPSRPMPPLSYTDTIIKEAQCTINPLIIVTAFVITIAVLFVL
jgi:hypothetical protein